MAILYFFLRYGSTILHKKFQVISSKNEGMMAIFVIFDFFLILWKCEITKNAVTPSFLIEMT